MAQNLELEAALIANPEDRETYRVYADWLQAQGDPRGELMALELRCEDAPSDGKLRLMTDAFRRRQAPALVGELAPRLGKAFAVDGLSHAVHWRRGFFHSVGIDRDHLDEPLAVVLAAVLEHPSSALLTALALSGTRSDEPLAQVFDVLGKRATRALRSLHLSFVNDVGDLSALHALPDLEHLVIETPSVVRPGRPMAHHSVSGATLRSIAAAPWPLRSLRLDLENSPAAADDLAPLLARSDLPLASLEIRRPLGLDRRRGFAMELCRLLVASPVAPKLETLRMWVADLARTDYKLLVEHRRRFRKLRVCTLPSRTFSERLVER